MWTTLRYAPSCPHIHTDYYDFDPVNTISHKGEMHFKNSTFGVLTQGSTLDEVELIPAKGLKQGVGINAPNLHQEMKWS